MALKGTDPTIPPGDSQPERILTPHTIPITPSALLCQKWKPQDSWVWSSPMPTVLSPGKSYQIPTCPSWLTGKDKDL